MNRHDALIEMAIQRGASATVTHEALNEVGRESVIALLEQMEKAPDSVYIVRKYVDEIMRRADEKGKLLDIADILLSIPNDSLGWLAMCLRKYIDNDRSISLMRQITNLEWASEKRRIYGAESIFIALYDKSEEALTDQSELVRIVAIRHFEEERNNQALIKALYNDIPDVRRIAVWYMGQRSIKQSTSALIELVQIEEDVETLRGIIWSLGVLQVKKAESYLKILLQHHHPTIRLDAQQALKKLNH